VNTYNCFTVFGAVGVLCREQFYAGIEAGWGAQILEHQECRIVVFADTPRLKLAAL
jgi:hypothetical protein